MANCKRNRRTYRKTRRIRGGYTSGTLLAMQKSKSKLKSKTKSKKWIKQLLPITM